MARALWVDQLRGRRVLIFIDSDSARQALVKGSSPSGASAHLAGAAVMHDALAGSTAWYARVPGVSNPADAPSRLEFSALAAAGGRRQRPSRAQWAELRYEGC